MLSPSLNICSQLPVLIVNAEEIASGNGQISNFQGLVTFTLNRVICRASLTDFYIHAKYDWNHRNFLWMDRHMDIWLGLTLLVDSEEAT